MIQNRFSSQLEWLALSILTICFFVAPISVALTTTFYLLAFSLILLFLFFSNHWRNRWYAIQYNKAALSFWILFALFLIGLFYTTSTTSLVFNDLHKRHWMLITPFFIMMIVDERWRVRMINAFLCAMVITVILSYLKYYHVSNFRLLHTSPIRDASVFNYHIVQNFAMSIAAFICMYRALFEKKWHLFYFILFASMAISIIFMSTGRTGYVIFFLLTIYTALIRFRWKGLVSACVTCVLLIGLASFVSHDFYTRMKAIYTNYQQYSHTIESNDIVERLQMWDVSQKMIRERPWFGYGTGGIRTAMQKIVPQNERVFISDINYVESIYLNFLLQFGVFGFLVLMIVLITQIRATFQLPHREKCLMQAFLIAILFGGFFNSFFVSYSVAHLYSLFSALCFSAWQRPATHAASSFKQAMR